MKLFDNERDNFQSYIEKSITSKHIELEVIFGSSIPKNPINKEIFLSLIDRCKENYRMVSEDTSLDIRDVYNKNPSNIRCTVKGIDNIKTYCKEDSLENINDDDIEYIQKKYYKDRGNPDKKYHPLKDLNYNVRLNIKTEYELSKDNRLIVRFLTNFKKKPKHFRYKKRFSFLTVDRLFRIDLSVVKSTKFKNGKFNFEKTFRKANILQNPETYELEVEYLGWEGDVGVPEIDLLYNHFKNNYITGPGKEVLGNIYDPLNLGIHIFDDKEVLKDPKEFWELKDVYTTPTTLLDFEEFESNKYLIGKYVKIKDRFFKENNVDLKLRDSLKKYYEKGHYIGMIKSIHKGKNGEMEALVSFEPKVADYSQLVVPINDLYDNLSFSPDNNTMIDIINDPEKVDIEQLEKLARSSGIPTELINEAIEVDKHLAYPTTLLSLLDKRAILSTKDDDPEPFLPSKMPDTDKKDHVKDEIINKVIEVLEGHIIDLTKLIYDTNTLISFQVKENIIQKYRDLTGQKKYYDFSFIGPQPKTLTMDNVKLNNPKSILNNYCVTEKADGERYELLITNNHGYLINSKQNVIDTKVTFENYPGDWLFDGEYITRSKENESIQLYMVFDVYWNGNTTPQPIHTYPFLSRDEYGVSRSTIMYEFFSNVKMKTNSQSIDIQVKQYEYGFIESKEKDSDEEEMDDDDDDEKEQQNSKGDIMGIFKSSEKILRRGEEGHYPYRIDGLIYLPLFLSVKSSIEGVQAKYIRGTWENNFKWKPEKENTIDFLVRVKKVMVQSKIVDQVLPYVDISEGGIQTTLQCKQLELYVLYDEYRDKSVDFCMKVLMGKNKDKGKKENEMQRFNFNDPSEEKYDKTNIPLIDGKMVCLNHAQDEIKDGDLVEMRFNPSAKNSMHWEPLRIRTDKTIPQASWVAYEIWDTINNPITEEMIQGKVELDSLIKDEKYGKYYVTEGESQLFESNSLKKLHNYIKSRLIGEVCSSFKGPIQILDLSFGQGGDTKKFLNKDIQCSFLLGLDISSNIHEACRRVYFENTNAKTAFFRADTSLNIRNGECTNIEGITDEERKHSESMINILYGMGKSVPDKYTSVQRKYNGIAKDGFHVISSQFSLHYYFKNETSLNGLIQNLKDNLKEGGYFIGTCYDGNKIFNHFKKMNDIRREVWEDGIGDEEDDEENVYEEYKKFKYKDIARNTVFSIEKKYLIEDFTYIPEERENMFGNKIEVYMDSIGQPIDEYLVNFNFFKDIMKENGFEIYVPKIQRNIFRKDYFVDDLGSFGKVIDNLHEIRKTDEVFRKYFSEAYEIKEKIRGEKHNIVIEPLQLEGPLETLSSFNNYFIFKKI